MVPNGDLVNALRDEKLLTVGAGDNVVRLLPPLIVGEAEIGEAIAARRGAASRDCARAAPRQWKAAG